MTEDKSHRNTSVQPTVERKIGPNVWLRQTETDGQFVEITMPPFELNDLLAECESCFPVYLVQLFEILAKDESETINSPGTLSEELTRGIRNTQILGAALQRHDIRRERAMPLLPELHQAFGLAMKGRLRLTADPIPDFV